MLDAGRRRGPQPVVGVADDRDQKCQVQKKCVFVVYT